MSWNRPTGNTKVITQRKRLALPFTLKLCSGLVIIVLGIIVWLFLRTTEGNAKRESNKSRHFRIKEVKPSISTNISKLAEVEVKPKERSPQKVGEVRDGHILLSTGELYPVKGVITSRCESVSLESRAFTCESDKLIGSLITIEPGEGLLGCSEEIYEEFDKQFEESLKTPIIISNDDPEDIKGMKQAVLDLRKELQQRKLAGESLKQIMIDSRNQLLELGIYRDELSAQVDKLMEDNEFSEKDAGDLVNAANQMLEERGAKPIELPIAAIYSIRRMATENKEDGEIEE